MGLSHRLQPLAHTAAKRLRRVRRLRRQLQHFVIKLRLTLHRKGRKALRAYLNLVQELISFLGKYFSVGAHRGTSILPLVGLFKHSERFRAQSHPRVAVDDVA